MWTDLCNVHSEAIPTARIYEEAIQYYDRIFAIELNYTYALNNKEAAIDYVIALYNKGNALDNLGKHEEAIQYYDKVLAIEPYIINKNYLSLEYGVVLYGLSRYEEAIQYFDQILTADPNNVYALTT